MLLDERTVLHHLGTRRRSVSRMVNRPRSHVEYRQLVLLYPSQIWFRQWLSCTCFFSQFYRVYSPVTFPKKYDPTGALVRHYCPELAKYPDKYINEPWKAFFAEQKKASCIIGVDFPERMIDDREWKEICPKRMKAAYEIDLKEMRQR